MSGRQGMSMYNKVIMAQKRAPTGMLQSQRTSRGTPNSKQRYHKLGSIPQVHFIKHGIHNKFNQSTQLLLNTGQI